VTARYDAPRTIDRAFNRVFAVPVDLLDLDGRHFLVAGRGRTQWVRNVEAAGELVLRKGRTRRRFTIRTLPVVERPAILKAYLDRFKTTVQRFFPIRAGSPAADFVDLADGYPVFELTLR
jgi:hypothetical protein